MRFDVKSAVHLGAASAAAPFEANVPARALNPFKSSRVAKCVQTVVNAIDVNPASLALARRLRVTRDLSTRTLETFMPQSRRLARDFAAKRPGVDKENTLFCSRRRRRGRLAQTRRPQHVSAVGAGKMHSTSRCPMKLVVVSGRRRLDTWTDKFQLVERVARARERFSSSAPPSR